MTKKTLYEGIAYIAAGLFCLALALTTEWQIEPLLWGLFGAGIGPGIGLIWKYFHWTRPGKREEYDARLKTERISMHDERKIMLRDKSGAIVYRIMLLVYAVLTFLCSILSVLDIGKPFTLYLTICCAVLIVVQYVLGILVFQRLEKKL